MATGDLKGIIASIALGEHLDVARAQEAFDIMMSGEATDAQIGAFLMGLPRPDSADRIPGERGSRGPGILPPLKFTRDRSSSARGGRATPAISYRPGTRV